LVIAEGLEATAPEVGLSARRIEITDLDQKPEHEFEGLKHNYN